MRRFLALIAVSLAACLTLAACGSSKPAASSSSAASGGVIGGKVTATGSFDTVPKVTIPNENPDNKLTVKTLIQGSGTTLTKADSLAANFVLYFWDGTSSTQKASTYASSPTLIGGTMLPGLESALIGQKVGSRVLAVIPPADGYGSGGDPSLGITGSTTLVFVIDVLKAYANNASASGSPQSNGGGNLPTVTNPKPGSAPVLTFPSTPPPSSLVVKTLVKGSGPKVVKGNFVVAQYVGYIWRTKKTFGESWASRSSSSSSPSSSSSGTPFGFIVGATPEQVIPGWDKGLVGQTAGSRVMLSIPPADGYGKSGASQAGIKSTDTLVFVVDILDTITPARH